MQHTVQAWLAQSAEPNDPHGIRVQATVRRDPAGFTLDLLLITPTGAGREQLVAAQCETLAGVVALKVALAADPGALFRAANPPVKTPPQWALRLTGGLGALGTPQLGPLLELGGLLSVSRVELRLGVGYGFPSPVRYAEHLGIGAQIDFSYAGARLCALPDMDRVQLPICIGADFGLLRGTGFGPDLERVSTSAQLYGGLVVGPGLRWPLTSRLAAWLGFEALLAFIRPSFHVRNLGHLFRPDPIGARAQLGIEWRPL